VCEQEVARRADSAQAGNRCPGGRAGLPRVYVPLIPELPDRPGRVAPWSGRQPGRVEASARDGRVLLSRNFCQTTDMARDFAWYYDHAMSDVAQRWRDRADQARRDRDDCRLRYATARVRSVTMTPAERLEGCGRRHAVIRCACRHVRVEVGCGLRDLCQTCARRIAKRRQKRLARALRAHQRAATAAWRSAGSAARCEPRWGLMTLTTAHSGDLRADRARILAGWQGMRKALWARFRRAVAFALVWETTPGSDGCGHVHAHVATLLPFLPYEELRSMWFASCPTSAQWDYQPARHAARGAAGYLSKYVSKTLEVAEFGPRLTAQIMRMNYGARVVTTSHRFWVVRPACRCASCKQLWELERKPQPMVSVRLARSLLDEVVLPRGSPQCSLPV
jgi:hypothetical protein